MTNGRNIYCRGNLPKAQSAFTPNPLKGALADAYSITLRFCRNLNVAMNE